MFGFLIRFSTSFYFSFNFGKYTWESLSYLILAARDEYVCQCLWFDVYACICLCVWVFAEFARQVRSLLRKFHFRSYIRIRCVSEWVHVILGRCCFGHRYKLLWKRQAMSVWLIHIKYTDVSRSENIYLLFYHLQCYHTQFVNCHPQWTIVLDCLYCLRSYITHKYIYQANVHIRASAYIHIHSNANTHTYMTTSYIKSE